MIKGLPDYIDPTRPPKSNKEAMLREDAAEWLEAYMKEYMCFKKLGVFEMVRIDMGMKRMSMTTRTTDGVQDHQ